MARGVKATIYQVGEFSGTIYWFMEIALCAEPAMRARLRKYKKGLITADDVVRRQEEHKSTAGNDEWQALSGMPRTGNLKLIPELTPFERRM